jgi:hypothetical protein
MVRMNLYLIIFAILQNEEDIANYSYERPQICHNIRVIIFLLVDPVIGSI